jgi:hypothetical protein
MIFELSATTASCQRPADPKCNKGQHCKNQEHTDDSELPNGATLGGRKLSAGAGSYIAYYEILTDHGWPLPLPAPGVMDRHKMPSATDFRCQAVPTISVRKFLTNLPSSKGLPARLLEVRIAQQPDASVGSLLYTRDTGKAAAVAIGGVDRQRVVPVRRLRRAAASGNPTLGPRGSGKGHAREATQ